ncbi:methyltransferase FkbM family [Methanolacinia petrolearia DSM 11571]|uniref:Methyltransferase FkbM family n=1 Tax=Methanolacinia petrolearia (strain DSM 11571 / OCM 486 / SEBR 4847) TaxID=679926 RepID=E1RIV2_METP4|nr:FkbM family methyltransferase [Methanolacinia petrolearia]ADN35540.1 methyltransferase FkbM family [Methanolacinia petrolearia DSM 11571]
MTNGITIRLARKFLPKSVRQSINSFRHRLSILLERGVGIKFVWSSNPSEWQEYLKDKDIEQKIDSLKDGLDKISRDYVDKYIYIYSKFSKSTFNNYVILPTKDVYTKEDFSNFKKYSSIEEKNKFNYIMPKKSIFPDYFMFFLKYGMKETGIEYKERCKGKSIIDLGAYNGDSSTLFIEETNCKSVYAYEPQLGVYNELVKFLELNDLKDKIIPLKKGIGDKQCKLFIGSRGGDEPLTDYKTDENEEVEVSTIDQEISQLNLNIGLIKMDIEGFEMNALKGGINTIKEQKPILLVCIYHNPKDFFEIKPYLESLKIGYKFMIRKSGGLYSPTAEHILIAY